MAFRNGLSGRHYAQGGHGRHETTSIDGTRHGPNPPRGLDLFLEDLEANRPIPQTNWLNQNLRDVEANTRVPKRLSYMVRKCIQSQEGRVKPTIPDYAEGDLYAFIITFMDGHYGKHELQTTPVPFPFIQMNATILLFYIFTIPFALLSDSHESIVDIASDFLVVFILIFGFVGMKLVSIELDDPTA